MAITKNMADSPKNLTLAVEVFQGGWLINSRAGCCAIEGVCKRSSRKNYRKADKKL